MKKKFIDAKNKINWSNVLTIILVLVLCLWRIPFLNKGIDYTDTGYSLENYKNAFLGDGIRGIGIFLTTLLGGIIYRLLPAYHLLVFRVLHWVLGLITYYFAYLIFKKYLNKNLILILLIGISLFSKAGEAIFSYYPLTSCLLVLSLLLLRDGLVDKNNIKIILSGFVAGINIFVRLPNVLFLSMLLCVLLYCYWSKSDIKSTAKVAGSYILGIIASLFITGGLMLIVLGPQTVVNSFMNYVRLALGQVEPGVENFLGIEEKSGHSLIAEFKTIGYQGLLALRSILIGFVPVIALSELIKYLSGKFIIKKDGNKTKKIYVVVLVFAALLVFAIREYVHDNITHVVYLISMGLSFLLLFIIDKSKTEYRLIFAMTFLMGCCSVIGSDLGLYRLGIINSMLILNFAFGIQCFVKQAIVSDSLALFRNNRFKTCLIDSTAVLVVALYVLGICCYLPKTYCDADFIELNYSVNDEITVLKGMKTSQIRADQINEYYEIMCEEELKGKEVAVFGYFPLGKVIGPQRDYFESVQPCIDYPSVSVERLLETIQEKSESGVVPVIVVSYVNQLQRGDDHYTSDAKMAVLEYMLSLNEYTVYSDDEYFTIYVPAKSVEQGERG